VWQLVGDAKPHSTKRPMPVMSGSMAVGAIDEIVTVRELIEKIIGEAEDLLTGSGPLGRILAAKG